MGSSGRTSQKGQSWSRGLLREKVFHRILRKWYGQTHTCNSVIADAWKKDKIRSIKYYFVNIYYVPSNCFPFIVSINIYSKQAYGVD
jgi:hypothetical protein